MMDNVLRQIRDNKKQQLYLPLSSFSGPKRSYLKRGIFVKTRQWCREMDCPNGCGGLAPIRKIASGRYVAVCTHGPVTEEVAVPAEEVELCEFDAVAFEREATQEEKDAMKLTVEGARKLIPVLERLKAVVEDACVHSKDGEFLFKRKDYVDAVNEIWSNQSNVEYTVAFSQTQEVSELWLHIRKGLVAYLKSIINGRTDFIRAFSSEPNYFLFDKFTTVDESPHVLNLTPVKELFCTLGIEEKPRKTIKPKKTMGKNAKSTPEEQVDIDALPLKAYRFSMTRNLKTIVDHEHREPDYHIRPYLGITDSAAKIIDVLIREAFKKRSEGWCKSEPKWRGRFLPGVCSRFKNEQIEIARREDGKFYWRIIPNGMFHEHYCKLFRSRNNW